MVELTPMKILECIAAILLPPVAVFLVRGCGVDLLINIVLCFLMYLPGMPGPNIHISQNLSSISLSHPMLIGVLHACYIVFGGQPAGPKGPGVDVPP
jgi:uncharacterized membrane protein YqaE (UPF0057 family)